MQVSFKNPGVRAGIASAVLFGASTPLAKPFTSDLNPWLIAGLLYLGSGLGIYMLRLAQGKLLLELPRENRLSLLGAVVFGGILAPVLLMLGLTGMAASDASLLLNTEVVFTAVIAWFVFKENFDKQILLGMIAIVVGALFLSFNGNQWGSDFLPTLSVLAACLCWGIDNNLTRNVSGGDALSVASFKGLVAGPTNLLLAFALGAALPGVGTVATIMAIGLLCYGISLVLFIIALRYVGTARAGAYYSVAPFFGAVLAIILGTPLTWQVVVAGLFMGIGVVLHLVERHEHEHSHGDLVHSHPHFPDINHRHQH
jgi:drug/metabolite transporter (DMT)-like permease